MIKNMFVDSGDSGICGVLLGNCWVAADAVLRRYPILGRNVLEIYLECTRAAVSQTAKSSTIPKTIKTLKRLCLHLNFPDVRGTIS